MAAGTLSPPSSRPVRPVRPGARQFLSALFITGLALAAAGCGSPVPAVRREVPAPPIPQPSAGSDRGETPQTGTASATATTATSRPPATGGSPETEGLATGPPLPEVRYYALRG